MSEQKLEYALVNNFRVQVQSYRLNRLLCWHPKRRLRVLLATNGSEVYCERCYRKRFGYTVIRSGETA